MPHATDTELIELAAEGLDESSRVAVEDHVAVCASCRARLDEMRAVWQALGRWEIDPVAHSLPSSVPAVTRRTAPWLRAAALFLVSVGAGVLTGRVAAPSGPPQPNGSLFLDEFQNGSPGLFAERVLGPRPTERVRDRPATVQEDSP